MLTSLSSCGKPGLESTCESGRCVFKYTDKVLCPKSLIETCELDGYKFDCIDDSCIKRFINKKSCSDNKGKSYGWCIFWYWWVAYKRNCIFCEKSL